MKRAFKSSINFT